MTTLKDVLHHIAADILDKDNDIRYEFNMDITYDPEASKEAFVKQYGQGKTYHFLLENRRHGKQLIVALYQFLSGKELPLPKEEKTEEPTDKPVYLLVHLTPAKNR